MAIRPPRRAVNRKPSGDVAALRPVLDAGPVETAAPEVRANGAGGQREQLIDQFGQSLREQLGQDNAELEAVLEHFRQTVEDVPLEPQLAGPDFNTWIETLEALEQSGLLDEDERETLIRQFRDAMAPLQDREAQIALEFAGRLERDGEEKALQWLSAQQQASDDDGAGTAPTGSAAGTGGKQEITRSRSRRLRGPPRIA
jgi:hypothetical protein